jgi:hypothetical protein
MILPTKNIAPERALLTIAGQVYARLSEPATVSRVWDEVRTKHHVRPISYAWFLLAVDLLFIMNLVRYDDNDLLHRSDIADALGT